MSVQKNTADLNYLVELKDSLKAKIDADEATPEQELLFNSCQDLIAGKVDEIVLTKFKIEKYIEDLHAKADALEQVLLTLNDLTKRTLDKNKDKDGKSVLKGLAYKVSLRKAGGLQSMEVDEDKAKRDEGPKES